jgi:DNA polymerase-3 subunit beta
MKIIIRTEELRRALHRVQGIAKSKSTMPILAHVLLEAAKDGEHEALRLSATDLDVGLSGEYQAEVLEPGAIALQARQLYDILKSLSTEMLELTSRDGNRMELLAGKTRFELVGMGADEFPSVPSHAQVETFTLPAADLLQLVDRTLFCVSTDEHRHHLSGVYCVRSGSHGLRMVATDGHMLALAEKTFESEIPLESGVIVPRKGLQVLKRVLSDADGAAEVELGFSGTNGLLRAGSVVLSTRLVEGLFPEYDQVIPQESERVVKLARVAFSDALRRVSLLSHNRAFGVRMRFEEGSVELTAEDPDTGRASDTLVCEFRGAPLEVGFNARYIQEVLSHISDESVLFALSDHLSPGVIRPFEEPGFLAVVMPMRI